MLLSPTNITRHKTRKVSVVGAAVAALVMFSNVALAGKDSFNTGPAITQFGENAAVPFALAVDANQRFQIAFDMVKQGDGETVHKKLNMLARFINMHVAAGLDKDNIRLAMVVHGKAAFDLLNDKAYQAKFGKPNPSAALLDELAKFNVDVYLCGQSAIALDIAPEALHNSVKVTLSAMTAHANLQQQGYTVNPF